MNNIENNINILSEFLYNNFEENMRGILYWKKHKQHICYVCRKKGHIAKDCKLICSKCGNMHSKALCIHSIEKELREFTKILKRGIIRDPLKLKMKMEEKHLSLQKEIIKNSIISPRALIVTNTDNFTIFKKHNCISVTERKEKAIRETFQMNEQRELQITKLKLRAQANLLSIREINEFKLVKKEREIRDRVKAYGLKRQNQLQFEYAMAHKEYMRVKNQNEKLLKERKAATFPELRDRRRKLFKEVQDLMNKQRELIAHFKDKAERRLKRKLNKLRMRWRQFNKNKNEFYKRKNSHYEKVKEFYKKKQQAYEAAKNKKPVDPKQFARKAERIRETKHFYWKKYNGY